MSSHLQRAMYLFGQSRFELAEPELIQALAEDPDDAMTHAVLALCLVQRQEYDKATREVELAIGLHPELPFAFYAQSLDECYVDAERIVPQPGSFYGGWITSDLVGPFKGAPGTLGW